MKKLKFGLSAVLMAVAVSANANTFQWTQMGVAEMAEKHATDYVVIKASDFTQTATNTAEAFSNSIPTNCIVQFEYLALHTPFDNGTNAFTTSTALTIGDGTTANLYLESTELNVDGTEILFRPAVSMTTGTVLTNLIAAATNYNSTFLRAPAAGVVGYKVYTTAAPVVLTFTPNSDEALSTLTSGEVRLYFTRRYLR
jgi:hypothetical protein